MEYQCANCRQTFESGRSDQEADAESLELWGVESAHTDSGMCVVCDDCFQDMTSQLSPAAWLAGQHSKPSL
jgi:hypothetical protein